eukprot:5437517-Amphidinium_carterae.1
MERAVQSRRVILDEPIHNLSRISTRAQTRLNEETEEIAILKAKSQFTERNMSDLRRVVTCEHTAACEVLQQGRAFYSYVEQPAKGFNQEESRMARDNFDQELRMYRQADARRQQQQFSKLQHSLRCSQEEATDRMKRAWSDPYEHEFRTELKSLHHELETVKQTHTDDDTDTLF